MHDGGLRYRSLHPTLETFPYKTDYNQADLPFQTGIPVEYQIKGLKKG